jgi:hypothetical protein
MSNLTVTIPGPDSQWRFCSMSVSVDASGSQLISFSYSPPGQLPQTITMRVDALANNSKADVANFIRTVAPVMLTNLGFK